jgi:hypothetical protein
MYGIQSALSENQGNFTYVYVNQTYGCEHKISSISDRVLGVNINFP